MGMQVVKYDFVEGAQKARGMTVIIDVFRAFSVACYCYQKGVSQIYPVADVEEARLRFRSESDVLRIGERHGKKLEGFDFGNSPTEILRSTLEKKRIIQTTHAGTQGLLNASGAQQVLTGALVNARATANYLKSQSPDLVSLVRMGWEANTSSEEDDICAEYLESLLLDKPFDVSAIKPTLRAAPCANRFFDSEQPWSPESDFDLCTEVDRFNFVLRLGKEDELIFLEKVSI